MVAVDTLTASLEDYLEVIYHVVAEKQAARPKDIARRMQVSNASVTGALRALAEKALINYAPHDIITLTPEGTLVAKDVVRRHEALSDFFVKVLAIDAKEADEAACLMEHSIPRGILERLIDFSEFVQVCPRGGANWIAGFAHHCDQANNPENCERCVATIQDGLQDSVKKNGGKNMEISTLDKLTAGQKGRILKVRPSGNAGRRIVEMGIAAGALVEVERIAPLGDPIDIKVKGYHLSLRKEEAASVQIEKLS